MSTSMFAPSTAAEPNSDKDSIRDQSLTPNQQKGLLKHNCSTVQHGVGTDGSSDHKKNVSCDGRQKNSEDCFEGKDHAVHLATADCLSLPHRAPDTCNMNVAMTRKVSVKLGLPNSHEVSFPIFYSNTSVFFLLSAIF